MKLKDKIVIITGASRGIGEAIAQTLAEQGAYVNLIGRSEADLNTVCSNIKTLGGNATAYPIDISNETAVRDCISTIYQTHQKMDILINNAGVGSFTSFEKFTEEEWDRIMNTNVKGTFLMTKHVVVLMKQQKSGQILTIASDVSKRTFADGAAYGSSKYAQDALMSTLRKEVRSFGIKVSVIYPGMVDTYFGETEIGEAHKSDWLKTKDIADAVSYVLNTPQNVVVDELMIHPMVQDY